MHDLFTKIDRLLFDIERAFRLGEFTLVDEPGRLMSSRIYGWSRGETRYVHLLKKDVPVTRRIKVVICRCGWILRDAEITVVGHLCRTDISGEPYILEHHRFPTMKISHKRTPDEMERLDATLRKGVMWAEKARPTF